MDTVSRSSLKAPSTPECGKTTVKMAEAALFTLMATFTTASGRMANALDMASTSAATMSPNTKVSGLTTTGKTSEFTLVLTARPTWDRCRQDSCMASENSSSPIKAGTLETTAKMRLMVTESLSSPMTLVSLETGPTPASKEKALTSGCQAGPTMETTKTI